MHDCMRTNSRSDAHARVHSMTLDLIPLDDCPGKAPSEVTVEGTVANPCQVTAHGLRRIFYSGSRGS